MVSAMSGGMFFFKFKEIEDMTMVMVGSFSYGKHSLVVAKWHPMLD